MSFNTDISTKLENSRYLPTVRLVDPGQKIGFQQRTPKKRSDPNKPSLLPRSFARPIPMNTLRKIARSDGTEFSKQSILNDMERFVKTVNIMDETVLIPSRLMNIEQDGEDDPFSMFAMLNDLKNELLWSGDAEEHVERGRRISDLSDTESDASSAAGDSGIEGEDERESAARAAAACRRHLRGLRRSLRQLTAAATHLTRSYQEEVGAPV